MHPGLAFWENGWIILYFF